MQVGAVIAEGRGGGREKGEGGSEFNSVLRVEFGVVNSIRKLEIVFALRRCKLSSLSTN